MARIARIERQEVVTQAVSGEYLDSYDVITTVYFTDRHLPDFTVLTSNHMVVTWKSGAISAALATEEEIRVAYEEMTGGVYLATPDEREQARQAVRALLHPRREDLISADRERRREAHKTDLMIFNGLPEAEAEAISRAAYERQISVAEADEMTSSEYRDTLKRLKLSHVQAARLFKVDERTGRRWATDKSVPAAVAKLLRLVHAGRLTIAEIRAM